MDHLPPECLVHIVRYLNLPDVACLLCTSKHWHSVITSNETIIYQRLAGDYDSRMGHGPFDHFQDALDTWASPSAKSIKSWKQYCKLQATTEQRWRGKHTPSYTLDFCGTTQTDFVQNIQIDLEKSLLLTTEIGPLGAIDRIVVRCLLDNSHPTLFTLFMEGDIIHRIELSNGFLVCSSQKKLSVWRWAQDQQRDPIALEPAAWQTLIYERAMQLADAPHRGELIPILAMPKPIFFLYPLIRFRYPVLCMWSTMTEPIRFWNLESRSFERSIELNQTDISIYHVPLDYNHAHVFVVLDMIMIYDRPTGDLVCQLECNCADLTRLYPTLPSLGRRYDWFDEYVLSHHRNAESTLRDPPSWIERDRVREVYISPTRNDLVGITDRGCIFHCPIDLEYPTASAGRISFTGVQIKLWSGAYDGHKIVAYGPHGLSFIYLVDPPEPGVFPAKIMHHIPAFRALIFGEHRRVEMTRDTCWLSWKPRDHGDTRLIVGMVDFARAFEDQDETAVAAES
ncbi:Transient-receptor-potential-like protein [Rhizoctonia solani]|uniref:Transient-receptor-potential-like protein n=1 Tax=Rhizoctonia solani TaxID=456999 RepID=A0A0K6FMI1_9AGAM|nr:Transient-receptor-potential-like protein [Rhizoctonia solani]